MTHDSHIAVLDAEPEPLELELERLAVMVIDMQNAFVSQGGMFDIWGWRTGMQQEIIDPIRQITQAMRARGGRVFYTAACYSPDLRETGGPGSPFWHKSKNIIAYREQPELRDRLTVRGTWGADFVEPLKPVEGDIVVEKLKYSAFVGTYLDTFLRTFGIKYLAFTGTATNICVEATLRDAHYRDYFPILVADACANSGPPITQEATIHNTKVAYGWVTTKNSLLRILEQ